MRFRSNFDFSRARRRMDRQPLRADGCRCGRRYGRAPDDVSVGATRKAFAAIKSRSKAVECEISLTLKLQRPGRANNRRSRNLLGIPERLQLVCETQCHLFPLRRHCDKNINANIVPVDMTVNALIISAYDVAARKAQPHAPAIEQQPNDIPIYNYVSSVQNPLTWGQFTDLNIEHGFKYPFSSAIW